MAVLAWVRVTLLGGAKQRFQLVGVETGAASVARMQQPVLLPLLPQILARDAEDLGGPLNATAAFRHGAADVFLLGVSEGPALGDLEFIHGFWVGGDDLSAQLGEIRPVQHLPVGEDHGALDDVSQLSHVARPIPALERLEALGADGADLLAELSAEDLAEMIGQA